MKRSTFVIWKKTGEELILVIMLNFEQDDMPPTSSDMMSEVLHLAVEHARADVVPPREEVLVEQYRAQAEVLHNQQIPCLREVNDMAATVLISEKITRQQLKERLGISRGFFVAALGYLKSHTLIAFVRVQEGDTRRYYMQPTEALRWAAQQKHYAELQHAIEDMDDKFSENS